MSPHVMSLHVALHQAAAEIRTELTVGDQRALDRTMVYLRSSGLASRALRTSEHAPDFELPSAAGGLVGPADLVRGGPAVVTFHWGGWSRCCMLYLRALQDREEEFAAAGATIVAVSAERAPELRASALLNGLRFDLLSDDGGRVARLFGLLVRVPDDLNASFARLGVDIARYTTIADQLLPLPATYVLDRDGVARYAHVDPDPARRPEPDALLAEIRRLTQAEVGP